MDLGFTAIFSLIAIGVGVNVIALLLAIRHFVDENRYQAARGDKAMFAKRKMLERRWRLVQRIKLKFENFGIVKGDKNFRVEASRPIKEGEVEYQDVYIFYFPNGDEKHRRQAIKVRINLDEIPGWQVRMDTGFQEDVGEVFLVTNLSPLFKLAERRLKQFCEG